MPELRAIDFIRNFPAGRKTGEDMAASLATCLEQGVVDFDEHVRALQSLRSAVKIVTQSGSMDAVERMTLTPDGRAAFTVRKKAHANIMPWRGSAGRVPIETRPHLEKAIENAREEYGEGADAIHPTAFALAAMTGHTSRRSIEAYNEIAKKLGTGLAELDKSRADLHAKKPPETLLKHQKTLLGLNETMPKGKSLYTAQGDIVPGRHATGSLSSAVLVLRQVLEKTDGKMSWEDQKKLFSGMALQKHIDLGTMQSARQRVTPRHHLGKEGAAEKQFRDLFGKLQKAGSASEFGTAAAEMLSLIQNRKLAEKAEALCFLKSVQTQNLGTWKGDKAYGKAFTSASNASSRIPSQAEYGIIREIATRLNDKDATEALTVTGPAMRRKLKNTADLNLKALSGEQRKLVAFHRQGVRRSIDSVVKLALMDQFFAGGGTGGLAALASAARAPGELRSACVETIKQYLRCDDGMAANLLDGTLDGLGPKPSMRGLQAGTHLSPRRTLENVFRKIIHAAPSEAARLEAKRQATLFLDSLHGNVEAGVDSSRTLGLRAGAVLMPVLFNAGLSASWVRGMTIEKEGSNFSLTLMRGISAKLDASVSDLGMAGTGSASGEAGHSGGVRLNFTSRAALEKFLHAAIDEHPMEECASLANTIESVSSTSVAGSLGLSATPLSAISAAGTYEGIEMGKEAQAAADAGLIPTVDPDRAAAVGGLNTTSMVMGVIPLQASAKISVSGSHGKLTAKHGDTVIRTNHSTATIQMRASAGVSGAPLIGTLTGVNPLLSTNNASFTHDGQRLDPGIVTAEIELKKAAAQHGHKLEVATPPFIPVKMDHTFDTKSVGGHVREAKREDVIEISPAMLADKEALEGILAETGADKNELLRQQLGRILAKKIPVRLVVQKEFTQEALERHTDKAKVGVRERHNAENFLTTGFELRYDVVAEATSSGASLSVPVQSDSTPINSVGASIKADTASKLERSISFTAL